MHIVRVIWLDCVANNMSIRGRRSALGIRTRITHDFGVGARDDAAEVLPSGGKGRYVGGKCRKGVIEDAKKSDDSHLEPSRNSSGVRGGE